jgi:hypothetical protein
LSLPEPKDPVVVPEVLDSLDDVRPGGAGGPMRQFGFSLGPGCGCLGLPVAVVGGIALSSLLALAWVARALRMLATVLPEIGRRLGGGRGPRRP